MALNLAAERDWLEATYGPAEPVTDPATLAALAELLTDTGWCYGYATRVEGPPPARGRRLDRHKRHQ